MFGNDLQKVSAAATNEDRFGHVVRSRNKVTIPIR